MELVLAHENRLKSFNEKPLEQAFHNKLKISKGENKNGHDKNYEKGESSYNRSKRRENFKNQGRRVNNQTAFIVNYVRKLTTILTIAVIKSKRCKKHTRINKMKNQTIPKIINPKNKYFTLDY